MGAVVSAVEIRFACRSAIPAPQNQPIWPCFCTHAKPPERWQRLVPDVPSPLAAQVLRPSHHAGGVRRCGPQHATPLPASACRRLADGPAAARRRPCRLGGDHGVAGGKPAGGAAARLAGVGGGGLGGGGGGAARCSALTAWRMEASMPTRTSRCLSRPKATPHPDARLVHVEAQTGRPAPSEASMPTCPNCSLPAALGPRSASESGHCPLPPGLAGSSDLQSVRKFAPVPLSVSKYIRLRSSDKRGASGLLTQRPTEKTKYPRRSAHGSARPGSTVRTHCAVFARAHESPCCLRVGINCKFQLLLGHCPPR